MRDRAAWTASLCALGLALLTTRGLESADAAVHLDLAIAMVERGETTLSIEPGALWVPSQPVAGGLFYQGEDGLRSASAPGLAFLVAPLVAVGGLLTDAPPPRFDALFEGGPPRAVLRPLQSDPRVIAFVLLGPLSAALAVFFFVRAGRALSLGPRALGCATVTLVAGSPLLAYAGTAWTQLPTMAGLAFLLFRACAQEPGWPVGIASALIVLVRPDHLPFVIALGLLWPGRERGRAWVTLGVPVGLALAFLVWWQTPTGGEGWALARLPEGASGLLLSPRAGLLLFAPFAWALPFGLARMPRRIAALVLTWLGCALILYGGWFDWPGSLAHGPRFLLPLLPALALGFGAALDRGRARIGWLALGMGLAVNLPGALLVHARIPSSGVVPAWRTLLSTPEVGTLGVDCASTYVLAYPLLALVVGLVGCGIVARGQSCGGHAASRHHPH